MQAAKMNKRVIHNGIVFEKDQIILPSDDGFKEMVEVGHAEEHEMSDKKLKALEEEKALKQLEAEKAAEKSALETKGETLEQGEVSINEMPIEDVKAELVKAHGYSKKDLKDMEEGELRDLLKQAKV